MRWIVWIFIICTILAPTFSKLTREKRSLSHIKKFLISHVLGVNKKTNTETSLRYIHSKNHENCAGPERQNLVIGLLPKTSKFIKIDERTNNEGFISSPLRQLLRSDIFLGAYRPLRGLISTLQSGETIAEETDSVIEDVSQQIAKYTSGDTFIVNQNAVLNTKVPKTTIFNYGRPQMLTNGPSVLGFWDPIISMPRQYSYEQIKHGTVEKYTLDKNADVIVTHTRNPVLPLPACIDDRIKEIIQTAPSSANPTQYSYPNIGHMTYNSPVSSSTPNRNEILKNSNHFDLINGYGLNSLRSTGNVQKNLLTNSVVAKHEDRNPVFYSVVNLKDLESSKNVDAKYGLQQPNNELPRTSLNQFELSDEDVDNVTVENANVQTRYNYKQETNNGVFKYGDTSNVSIIQDGGNLLMKMSPNNISVYTGDPIVVAPTDETAKAVVNRVIAIQDQRKKNASLVNEDKPRGDIPGQWYTVK